jgi:branched-chain amino acid transport system ATP-binding protein
VTAPLLELKGVCKQYGRIVVADDVSFTLDAGCLGLVGPNGAGKTSLFNMIAGTVFPDSGAVFLDGRDVSAVPSHARVALGVIRAFQIPQPFTHLTVFENVLIAAYYGGRLRGAEAERWCVEVLARLQLADKGEQLAGHLRLLDRKRLELAKAVASRARLLLLDEIAGGLTEQEVDELLKVIAGLKQDHALIWIEHIPRALKAAADRILVLHFGKLLIDGTPDEVMASAAFREIYMGLPAGVA